MDYLRYVEVKNEAGEWVQANLQDVKKGQIFRVFEEGKPIEDREGEVEFTAKMDASFDETIETWTIEI